MLYLDCLNLQCAKSSLKASYRQVKCKSIANNLKIS
nr:MAG TPA: hypothetical protein [Caudoviricetes sp.]